MKFAKSIAPGLPGLHCSGHHAGSGLDWALVFHFQTARSEDESRALIKSLMATVYNTAAIATFANNQQIGQDAIDGLLKNDVVQRAELKGNRG